MASFNFPQSIDPNTPAIATEVQTNFDALLAWILANLVQVDGTKVMTGPLTLMAGDPASGAFAANKAYVDSKVLVGEIKEYAGTVLPTGYLWCNGDTYSETDQPALFAVVGRGFTEASVPTGSFQVPDKRGKVSVGYHGGNSLFRPVGFNGGQADTELLEHLHSVPAHNHAFGGLATGTTGSAHTHTSVSLTVAATGTSGGANQDIVRRLTAPGADGFWTGRNTSPADEYLDINSAGALALVYTGMAVDYSRAHTHTLTVSGSATGTVANTGSTHTHNITGSTADKPAFNTVNTGAGTTLVNKNYQPYLVTNFMIYAGEG